jgi:hypothetical protein
MLASGGTHAGEKPVLHGPDAGLCCGVRLAPPRGEVDDPGPAIVWVSFTGNEPLVFKRVKERYKPGFVVADRFGKNELTAGWFPSHTGQHDVIPHRQAVAVEELTLRFEQPARCADEESAEILSIHVIEVYKR